MPSGGWSVQRIVSGRGGGRHSPTKAFEGARQSSTQNVETLHPSGWNLGTSRGTLPGTCVGDSGRGQKGHSESRKAQTQDAASQFRWLGLQIRRCAPCFILAPGRADNQHTHTHTHYGVSIVFRKERVGQAQPQQSVFRWRARASKRNGMPKGDSIIGNRDPWLIHRSRRRTCRSASGRGNTG